MALTCTHLACGYHDHPVLRDVTLSFERGTITALVGLSGVGKSTLLKALGGSSVILGGSVTSDGTRGLVGQNPEKQLFAETAFQDVAFGPTNQDLSEEEVQARVEQALRVVNISVESAREKSPFAYSGGEQRRVAIAGILAMQPDYLLFDEPTAGLDVSESCCFWNLVRRLADSERGVVVSTHDLVSAEAYADRIVVVANGRVFVWQPSLGSLTDIVAACGNSSDFTVFEKELTDSCNGLAFEAYGGQRVGVFSELKTVSDNMAARLDPRTKIITCLALLVATALAKGPIGLCLVAFSALGVLFACRIPPQKAFSMLRPFVGLLLGILLFDVLFTPGKTAIWTAGVVSITVEGIAYALDTAIRFMGAFLIAGSLRFCADPTEIADGFRMLANPFRRFGASVDEMALSLSITFRFVPILQEEYHRIVEAQNERGASFYKGGMICRIRNYASTLTPLSISVIRRAVVLAQAMENRSYAPGVNRTCLRTYHMHIRDILTLVVTLMVVAVIAAI